MTKKILSLLTLFLLVTSSLFAESIGFTSVHSGFWWWAGAVAICGLSIFFISPGLNFGVFHCYLFHCDLNDYISGLGVFISIVFSILGFFVIPSIWCGLVSAIVGEIIFISLSYCGITCATVHNDWPRSDDNLIQKADPHPWVLSSLICALTIAAEVFVMIYLPNNWWLWKYISVAVLGSGIANILALDSHYFKQRKATLIGTILLIVDFIAFWIVFGICWWNVASVILGIIFCLLVFVSLISPFICMIIKKVQKDMKELEEAWAILEQVKKLALEISKNPNFIEVHSEYKEFYEYYKTDIDNRVQKILNDIKEQETKKIHEEQEQKKLEREEDARETAFQKNLKSISEDIDALELAAGKGVFNIQQLTILENHLSVLTENKSIFNENNKNILKRKKKYLEAIFRDCEQIPDCKSSSKIRMEEILKMLDDLSSFEE